MISRIVIEVESTIPESSGASKVLFAGEPGITASEKFELLAYFLSKDERLNIRSYSSEIVSPSTWSI
jgi:hypothetical protein